MKYLQLITNKYCLALTAIMIIALLCIMSTSEITFAVILFKVFGFILAWIYCRLYKKWDSEGKVNPIRELFNDDEDEIVI